MQIRVPTFNSDELAALSAEAAEDGSPVTRPTQFFLELLSGLDGREADVATIGWLALWSRGWQLLISSRMAADAADPLCIAVLYRVVVELDLHCHLILTPLIQLAPRKDLRITVSEEAQAAVPRQVHDRLAGYAVWCMEEDERYLHGVRAGLTAVYDGADARAIFNNPQQRAAHEALYGPLELENQHALDRGRERHAAFLDGQLEWLRGWQEDPVLDAWRKRFRQVREASRSAGPVSIFALLGDSENSVRQRLQARQVGFLYAHYARGSHLLHGSSVLSFLTRHDASVGPEVGVWSEPDEALLTGIVDTAMRTAVNLQYLKGLL
jgi:hypothetical protein